ncbi:CAP domain-containing protein [Streptomyces sp. NPDC060194]|uniref:CAP domain-containing protein n=1 Tax=Streptomyces sp. NPDC060194 TaxID=3347069 RepID=UPI00365C7CBE
MIELAAGGNRALPEGVLTLAVVGPFDLSVLITDDGRKVADDADFVFYNQPVAPGARLTPGTGSVVVDPAKLRSGATRVTLVVSPEEDGVPLGSLPVPTLTLTGADRTVLARFTPPRPTDETVLLLAEVYRRGGGWKVRALGQGYADGLAGVARDFGVDLVDGEEAAGGRPQPAPHAPTLVAEDGGFLRLVNADRARAGIPPLREDPRLGAAARTHAANMARQGRLSVEDPDGMSVYQRVTAGGYTYLTIAEHLVSGPRTPGDLVDHCLDDARARRPLRDPSLTDAGVGHATDDRSGEIYWTALWARPLTPDGLARTTAEVVTLTNAERASAGLRPLAADPRLATAAQAYSTDMAARDFYSHTSPEGLEPRDRAVAAGATHRGIGENIACGQRTAADVVRGWMNSPGHRANILRPDFTHIGTGFSGGGRAGTYWTQLFGATG